jgi:hypothetical protein
MGEDVVPAEAIERLIVVIRGDKVILDADLARLYGVETRRLNEQVRRNSDRFPADFMFQLSADEMAILKSHFATSRSGWGGSRKPPLAFTEHGAIMAAAVLNSPKAVETSIFVVRVFVRLRALLAGHKELAARVAELERKLATHDGQIIAIIEAIKQLMAPPLGSPMRRPIGFRVGKE